MNYNDYSDDKNSELEDYDEDGAYLWDDNDPKDDYSSSDHLADDLDVTFENIREKEADYIENKPMCPLCGKVLIMRPSNFNKGEFWWGCSGFPDCTYKVNEKNYSQPPPKYEKHSHSNINNKKESPKMDDLGDIFGGLGDVFGFSGGGSRRQRQGRGSDIQVLLNIDFSEAVFGVEKEISLKKTVKCSKCQGSGAEPGSGSETCKTCGGKRRVVRVQRTILGNMQVQMTCEDCHGEGKTFKEKCSACRGAGLVQEIVNLKVKIPAGIDNNETIRLSGQGEAAAKGGQAGDLYIKVRVNADKDLRCKPDQANDLKDNLKNKARENIINDIGEINLKKGKSNNKFILYCFYFVFGISVVCFFIAIIVVLINIFGYFIK